MVNKGLIFSGNTPQQQIEEIAANISLEFVSILRNWETTDLVRFRQTARNSGKERKI